MLPVHNKLKGKVFHSQSRELVSNVYKFMKSEASIGTPINLTNARICWPLANSYYAVNGV
jgi:hypothetical protein